ncbi:M20/M25/M40 family metallo-hydrolase [Rhodococcus kronopolitis]|uniref:M20/M25/M40 family metallo-hydrolase n=1 Tax=Rhodococcus kronopolitis TaxID=1460226 RepID=A0ABV9FTS3_9NOCA
MTARSALPATVSDLTEWIRIPSVSGSARYRGDVDRAALLAARWLRVLTPTVCVIPSPSGPTVLARIRGRHPGRPATVVYGHFDVRPAGPGWRTGPFEPTRRGARLVGRGASDDKGQLMAHLAALRAWSTVGGPPHDVLLVLDGAEEIGSPHLAGVLGRWRRRPTLAGPVAATVVSDTRADTHGDPTVTVSQRGMLALRVTVTTRRGPVHAGRFGGAVLDPTLWLAAAVHSAARDVAALRTPCTLRTPTVPGTGSSATRVDAHTAARSGALTVNSFRSGAAPGAIPAAAAATLDIRIPPGMRTDAVESHLRDVFGHHLPRTATVSVTRRGRADGRCLDHDDETRVAIDVACRLAFHTAPTRVSSGGSIPAVAVLADIFGPPPVLLGFGPVDDGAHGPNEYLDLAQWARAVDTCTALISTLTRDSPPAPKV